MTDKKGNAFITSKKGFCYLTVKIGRSNFNLMRIRKYTLEPQDKRNMRRLYPDYTFDWKKINLQLAEKREVCRSYRSRRQKPRNKSQTPPSPVFAAYHPGTRTIYTSDLSGGDPFALLDAVLDIDRSLKK